MPLTPKFIGIALLGAAASVESVAQACLKVGASGGPRILCPPYRDLACRHRISASANGWTFAGLLLYGAQILLWSLVLHALEVSIAFPMDSLCFVGVALLSMVFLGETVGPVRWLGVFCIVAGSMLLAL